MKQKKILVVDDDMMILEGYKMILSSAGYDVDTVTTGAGANSISKDRVYDIALIDIKLPDILGTELLARIHSYMP